MIKVLCVLFLVVGFNLAIFKSNDERLRGASREWNYRPHGSLTILLLFKMIEILVMKLFFFSANDAKTW